ncbi:hypothetical protein AB0395_29540 [Streptosporangium sp. NPDC051023]|uniref:hypothetical protein n=1 Tax=Streptosporangium sp. NPDC051023 TaxID=3155410 RepID=UPI00344BC727
MDYIKHWTPEMSAKDLLVQWTLYGGMKKYEPQKVTVTAGGVSYYQSSIGKVKITNYGEYGHLLKYWKVIRQAADNHHIDRNVFLAVLIYESSGWENKMGKLGQNAAESYEILLKSGKMENASIGIAQMEVYKARIMLDKYYSKERDWKHAKAKTISDELFKNPERAIHLAAAWMRYLKENIKYKVYEQGRWENQSTQRRSGWTTSSLTWRPPAPTADARG